MNSKRLLYYLVFVTLIFTMGCESPKPASSSADSTKMDTFMMKDTSRMSLDTSKMSIDTGIIEKHNDIKKDTSNVQKNPPFTLPKELKYGILGYSYPPSITVGESKNIHAYISIIFPESKVRDTLVKIVVNDDSSETNDSVVVVKRIRLFKFVSITLASMDTILKVTSNNPNAKQQVDTLEGNKWSWAVYAKTADHPKSKLKLKIETEGPSSFEEKTITININVEPHFWRKIYDWLMNNPKVLIGSILIPFITFLGTKIFKKK